MSDSDMDDLFIAVHHDGAVVSNKLHLKYRYHCIISLDITEELPELMEKAPRYPTSDGKEIIAIHTPSRLFDHILVEGKPVARFDRKQAFSV